MVEQMIGRATRTPPTMLTIIQLVGKRSPLHTVLATKLDVLVTAQGAPQFTHIADAINGYEEDVLALLSDNEDDNFRFLLTTGNDIFYIGNCDAYEKVIDAVQEYLDHGTPIPEDLI